MDKFELVSTISGKTYKFSSHPNVDLLIDLPSNIIIGIKSSISLIECFIPNHEDIYHYTGDLSFNNDEGNYSINFHSEAISALSFNDAKMPISENSYSLRDVKINLELDKSLQWFDTIRKSF